MPRQDTAEAPARASEGVLRQILVRARELEKLGECYVPRTDADHAACVIGHAAGLLARVRGYTITSVGLSVLGSDVQPGSPSAARVTAQLVEAEHRITGLRHVLACAEVVLYGDECSEGGCDEHDCVSCNAARRLDEYFDRFGDDASAGRPASDDDSEAQP